MKYRNLKTVQGILTGLRPAIVAMIGSAGLSLLFLALFNSSLDGVVFADFRIIEGILFIVSMFLLRRYRINPIIIIFGSGIFGTIFYMLQ